MPLPLPITYIEDPQIRRAFEEISLKWPAPASKISLTTTNLWVGQAGYPAPSAFKYGDMVTIVGVFDGTAATTVNAFTLPTGWYPTATIQAVCPYYVGGVFVVGAIQVPGTGVVGLYGNNATLVKAVSYQVNITYSVRI